MSSWLFEQRKCGRWLASSALLLLATHGKNTIVILWIGCGASAVHRFPPRIAGFLLSAGQSSCAAQAVSVTIFDTAAASLPFLQSTGFAQFLHAAVP